MKAKVAEKNSEEIDAGFNVNDKHISLNSCTIYFSLNLYSIISCVMKVSSGRTTCAGGDALWAWRRFFCGTNGNPQMISTNVIENHTWDGSWGPGDNFVSGLILKWISIANEILRNQCQIVRVRNPLSCLPETLNQMHQSLYITILSILGTQFY